MLLHNEENAVLIGYYHNQILQKPKPDYVWACWSMARLLNCDALLYVKSKKRLWRIQSIKVLECIMEERKKTQVADMDRMFWVIIKERIKYSFISLDAGHI